jgi:polysaccharide deacetylase family protein (PEP-CTERM system associated)
MRTSPQIAPKYPTHVLSVDVEDYFQVEAFADRVGRQTWDQWPSRVVANTQRLLDLFDARQVKGTFFFLGWVAHRFPALVKEVHGRGHELACHSFWHRTVPSLKPEEFRHDTRQARDAIEQAAGIRVVGYRAPTWSITGRSLWALDILAEEGFVYDSSIYPIHHDLYGVPGAQRFAYTHMCTNGRELREFPPSTVRILGLTLPAGGGGYLRVFPMSYTRMAFERFQNEYRQPMIVYLHPWEVDPEQPRIPGKLRSRFRHYTNLKRTEGRLDALLRRYRFHRFQDLLSAETVSEGCLEVSAAARA